MNLASPPTPACACCAASAGCCADPNPGQAGPAGSSCRDPACCPGTAAVGPAVAVTPAVADAGPAAAGVACCVHQP